MDKILVPATDSYDVAMDKPLVPAANYDEERQRQGKSIPLVQCMKFSREEIIKPINTHRPIEGNDNTVAVLTPDHERNTGTALSAMQFSRDTEEFIDDGGSRELLTEYRAHDFRMQEGIFEYALSLREIYEVHLRDTEEGLELRVTRTSVQVEQLCLNFPDMSDTDEEKEVNNNTKKKCECCGKNVKVLQSERLRKVRDKGAQIIRGHLFPLFSRIGNELIAFILFMYAVVMLGLSLRTFILICSPNGTNCTTYNPTEDINYTEVVIQTSDNPIELVRFTISAVSVVLALLNILVSMRHCFTLRWLCSCKKLSCSCRGRKKVRPHFDNTKPVGIIKQAENKSCSSKFRHFWVKYVNDLFRLIVVEALLYPSLICNILDNAGSRTYEGTSFEKFAFARFIFSCVSIIWNVYIIRLIVLSSTVHNLEKLRTTKGPVIYDLENDDTESLPDSNPNDANGTLQDDDEDTRDNKRRARRGLVLEIFFLFHVFGQMLTQAFMIVAIWSKVQCENPENIENGHLYISPFTWVMIVLGFLVPILGTFTFFIPTYYWGQEYPIDFMINFLSTLKKASLLNIKTEGRDNSYNIVEQVGKIRDELVRRNFCKKVLYAFFDPALILLSIGYDILLLSFAVFYFFTLTFNIPNGSRTGSFKYCSLFEYKETQIGYRKYQYHEFIPTGWFIFGMVGIGIGNVANILVVLNGLIWGVIAPIILLPVNILSPIVYSLYPWLACYFCRYTKRKMYLK